MKPLIIITLTTLSFLLSNNTRAQDYEETETLKIETPKWACDKGYWVVESNKKTPKESTVYFYSNENILVYKEEIHNKKLKVKRKKILLRLKATLEEAINNYEKGTWAHQNNLLITQLRQ